MVGASRELFQIRMFTSYVVAGCNADELTGTPFLKSDDVGVVPRDCEAAVEEIPLRIEQRVGAHERRMVDRDAVGPRRRAMLLRPMP